MYTESFVDACRRVKSKFNIGRATLVGTTERSIQASQSLQLHSRHRGGLFSKAMAFAAQSRGSSILRLQHCSLDNESQATAQAQVRIAGI